MVCNLVQLIKGMSMQEALPHLCTASVGGNLYLQQSSSLGGDSSQMAVTMDSDTIKRIKLSLTDFMCCGAQAMAHPCMAGADTEERIVGPCMDEGTGAARMAAHMAAEAPTAPVATALVLTEAASAAAMASWVVGMEEWAVRDMGAATAVLDTETMGAAMAEAMAARGTGRSSTEARMAGRPSQVLTVRSLPTTLSGALWNALSSRLN